MLWNEGMLLTPHHFQQQDNYHEEQLSARLASLVPYEWGVLDLQLNEDSIANGTCEIVRCRAVMPDGLIVNIPQRATLRGCREADSRPSGYSCSRSHP